jgi:hypothetical protein
MARRVPESGVRWNQGEREQRSKGRGQLVRNRRKFSHGRSKCALSDKSKREVSDARVLARQLTSAPAVISSKFAAVSSIGPCCVEYEVNSCEILNLAINIDKATHALAYKFTSRVINTFYDNFSFFM